jgi:beta-galactosidase/beta-glucuronidase
MRIETSLSRPADAYVLFRLVNTEGEAVHIPDRFLKFSLSTERQAVEVPISDPLKWDAEHPYLYTLYAELNVGGDTLEIVK